MGILSWIIVGAIAGWLAGLVMKGKGFGLIGNIVVGIIGALIGGWLAGVIFHVKDVINGVNPTTIVVALLGSILVLSVTRLLRR